MNWVARNQLVKIELAAILIFHLALISMALLVLMAFTIIGEPGNGAEFPLDPQEAKVFTPVGILFCGIVVGLPGTFLVTVGWALHRYVVVPRAAGIEDPEEDGAISPP